MKKLGFLKRHAIRILLSLLIALPIVLHALGVFSLGFVGQLENYSYDLRLQATMPNTLEQRVVILDIDEKSLQEQGHWPWPRNKLAHLVDLLFDHYKIDVLGFDMLFAEPDESSGLKSLEQLGRSELRGDANFNAALDKIKPQLNYDQLFADSLKNRRVVLGYYFRQDAHSRSSIGVLPAPVLRPGSFDPHGVGAVVAKAFAANLPELQGSASAGGFFDLSGLTGVDGVVRRMALLQMYQGALYETLGLAVARLALREPDVELGYTGANQSAIALEFLRLGQRRLPVDEDVAALIPFRGSQGSFVYIPASDVLQGLVPAASLMGAIVLVGTTAPGLKDLRTAPMQESYAGVEMHANLITGILDNNIKQRPAYTIGLEFSLLLLVGLLLAFALPLLKPFAATLLCLVIMVGWTGLNVYLWESANQVAPLASVLLLTTLLFVFNMSYGFFVEARGKRLITGLFGQYVPPELVDEMAKDPTAYTLAGESRELSVLFSDVRGFTTISEGLDPVQLTQLMNDFLTPMTQVIHRHHGTIDKYMGDAIMAFWGAPVHDEQHARNALLAGLEMIATLETLQDKFKAKGWPPVRVGVGVNTGAMTVGNMGSEFRLAYTVMGDAVNLGSRLESLTRQYDVGMIVSEFTRAAAPDFVYRELDCVRVKGKDRPVRIYEVIGPVGQTSVELTQEIARYSDVLALYRAQNWRLAAEKFAELQGLYPERYLYKMYLERIAYFVECPPAANWDGAFTFVTK